ncbi:Na(+)/H(+) antiporter subunit D [Candidatus Endowatersipora endosymbiont of Watersipora subatra]|uniref:Na(+)/H(+) antiporter subunit D n=1 Tax=Candidatus Endowatersipora endosymbiont of Watersipora subatra TaxID=3077946 RepID=UPI00312C74ED
MIELSSTIVTIPVFYFFLGSIVLPFLPKGNLRALLTIMVPFMSGFLIWHADQGSFLTVQLSQFSLEFMRVDKLSIIFGLIFSIAAFISSLYAWHIRDTVQQIATLLYAGSAIGAVFAGDFISLFIYWESTTLASVFLIWARRTEGSYQTGIRYLIIQIGSGVILISGIALHYSSGNSIVFSSLTDGGVQTWNAGVWLIFLAFGIKCAFPFLHNWLQDAYPAATVTGTVTLSAFTTKMAVYCLARSFPGTEILIYIGAIMTIFPIFFAEIETDLRRVLAYSINNQLGFMVVGIGIGTELSLNGSVAHAFAHILYKALLFMSVGSVLYRTGTSNTSELGGLYRTMPYTMIFCIVGAASISAFPLFSGFIAKSLILDSAAKENYHIVWAFLVFASAGVLSHSGIKIPYFTFFSHDSGKRPKEAPVHMLCAMGITAFLCLLIGVRPEFLYFLLPYEGKYEAYSYSHIITQMQLLCFALLAFVLLVTCKVYPDEERGINVDTDWIYRKFGPSVINFILKFILTVWNEIRRGGKISIDMIIKTLLHWFGPYGVVEAKLPTGRMVLSLAIFLGAVMGVTLFKF